MASYCPICDTLIERYHNTVKIRTGRGKAVTYHEKCVEDVRERNGFRNFNIQHKKGGYDNEENKQQSE